MLSQTAVNCIDKSQSLQNFLLTGWSSSQALSPMSFKALYKRMHGAQANLKRLLQRGQLPRYIDDNAVRARAYMTHHVRQRLLHLPLAAATSYDSL